jgi:hypothetical protein
MTPIEIIRQTRSDGLVLSVSETGGIKFEGNRQAAEKWKPVLREHKAALIAELQSDRMSAEQETAILAWLAFIGENDIVTLGEVIEACRRDADARAYFLGRASERLVGDGKAD